MDNTQLLDFIETKDGKQIYGIVDYISTKHAYVFDFTKSESPDLILMVVMWRSEDIDIRFSIYCLTHFPAVQLPSVVLIHKADIQSTNVNIIPTNKPKQRNFTIKEQK